MPTPRAFSTTSGCENNVQQRCQQQRAAHVTSHADCAAVADSLVPARMMRAGWSRLKQPILAVDDACQMHADRYSSAQRAGAAVECVNAMKVGIEPAGLDCVKLCMPNACHDEVASRALYAARALIVSRMTTLYLPQAALLCVASGFNRISSHSCEAKRTELKGICCSLWILKD